MLRVGDSLVFAERFGSNRLEYHEIVTLDTKDGPNVAFLALLTAEKRRMKRQGAV